MTATHSVKHKNKHNGHSHINLHGDYEKIKRAIQAAKDDLTGKAEQVFYDSIDGIKEKSNQVKDNVADYAGERPFKSLGLAALTGFIIGYLVHK